MQRPSTVARVTGTALYGADMADKLPPDTLHLALAQATVLIFSVRWWWLVSNPLIYCKAWSCWWSRK